MAGANPPFPSVLPSLAVTGIGASGRPVEAWPWPDVDPDTRFLNFDLDRSKSRTLDLADLQRKVNALRIDTEEDEEVARSPESSTTTGLPAPNTTYFFGNATAPCAL